MKLLYDVRTVVQDCQSALDWTATTVRNKLAPGPRRGPYFPLVGDPLEFDRALDKEIAGLRLSHPTVADAFRRHQPFQPDKSELGYLHKLARVNKHQDFTGQTRTETPQLTLEHGGARVRLSGNARIVLRGNARLTLNGESIGPANWPPPPDSGITIDRRVLVDWRFNDPPIPVRRTLQALARQVREAVHDVRSSAERRTKAHARIL